MPQEHHFSVIVTSYPSRKAKLRAEREGWYPGMLSEYKQRTVYHGFNAARAKAAFYSAVRAAQRHPLTIYITVWRDAQIYMRARPEAFD